MVRTMDVKKILATVAVVSLLIGSAPVTYDFEASMLSWNDAAAIQLSCCSEARAIPSN